MDTYNIYKYAVPDNIFKKIFQDNVCVAMNYLRKPRRKSIGVNRFNDFELVHNLFLAITILEDDKHLVIPITIIDMNMNFFSDTVIPIQYECEALVLIDNKYFMWIDHISNYFVKDNKIIGFYCNIPGICNDTIRASSLPVLSKHEFTYVLSPYKLYETLLKW